MVTLHLKCGKEMKHCTFWRSNCSLLRDPEYAKQVKSEIMNIMADYTIDNHAVTKASQLIFQHQMLPLKSVSDKVLDFM